MAAITSSGVKTDWNKKEGRRRDEIIFVVLSSGLRYTAFAKSFACALDGFNFGSVLCTN